MFGRRKRRRGGADFRNDLLRGIDAQPGDLGQSLHRSMVSEELRPSLIESVDVVFG